MKIRKAIQVIFFAHLFTCASCCFADSTTWNISTLAGAAGVLVNSIDGTGSAAQFYSPRGVAADSAGNVFVADSSNNTLRKVTPEGVVTTLAGTAGVQGRSDGTGAAALFRDPYAVAADVAGNLYVADTSNNTIRKITSAGVVTTIAGNPGVQGSADGSGAAAMFSEPRGVAVDTSGNIFVADYGNEIVRKITPAGVVSTFAGRAGSEGSADGTGPAARFRGLQGVAVDGAGNVYVTDAGNRTIRKITSAGAVTTLAGTAGMGGAENGAGAAASFAEPRGIASDAAGTLYVADYGAHTLRKITPAGVVSTLAGSAPNPGTGDGSSSARFNYPSGVTVDGSGNVYVADTSNNTLRKITSAGIVTTLAGLAGRSSSVDGAGTVARFEDPYAVAVDSNGNVYVADATDHTVRKITPYGVTTTLAGKAGSFGSTDGAGDVARFRSPFGIAVDAAGTVYLADTGNHTIRKITAAGMATVLAGSAGSSGSLDGTGAAARFTEPNAVAVDSAGNVYVADTGNQTIRKITPAGVVTTMAGSPGVNGMTNGTGSAASFRVPFDLTVDAGGNIYVCDHGNHAVRMITPAGVVTTLAGSGSAGSSDGAGTAASFSYPSGIAVDTTGNVFIADTDNQIIRQISPAGVVTSIAGATRIAGSADGAGSAARFFNPKDVAVDGSGNLYMADRSNHTIRKGSQSANTTAPQCTLAASPSSITLGATATLTASCSPAATSYTWTAATGLVAGTGNTATVTPAAAGAFQYAVTGNNAAGAGNSASAIVTVTAAASDSARLINLSTRGQVQTGDNIMIGGFVIGGSVAKQVLIRAVGPNLANYGVTGVLANPALKLLSGQTQVASNDDWGSAANAAAIQATGKAPVSALESAILTTLSPGTYTAQVSGVGGGTGVGIVEVFEMDQADSPLINISTRGQVQTGDNVMIGGFVIGGSAAQTVLIRAVGPNLANYGVTGVLANPMLQLYAGQTLIASNDDWGSAANAAAIEATGKAPVSPLESAILVTLSPGIYTAKVSGVGGGAGVGIVEVFAQ